jgi:hypothetical protein
MSLREQQPTSLVEYSLPITNLSCIDNDSQAGLPGEPIEPIDTSALQEPQECLTPSFLDGYTSSETLLDPRCDCPPLPLAAPTFAEAFARFEPMFHAVFYRKYHPEVRNDAKQVALLALFLKWSADKTLFDQSAAFVVTAAIFGISNWRKKEQKRPKHEQPLKLDENGHVLGMPKSHQVQRWTDRVDLKVDVERAIDSVLLEFTDHPQYKAIYCIVQDMLKGAPMVETRGKTGLSRREFKTRRDEVKTELVRQLREYAPSGSLGMGDAIKGEMA